LLDNSQENPYTRIGIEDTIRPWTLPEARDLARKATVKSAVLLKNEGILPLDLNDISKIAVIGPSADLVVSDWYAGTPPYAVSVLDGVRAAAGDRAEIKYAVYNKADSAIIAARESDVAIVCVGNHPLGYGVGWGENHVPSDGREAVDRQAISLEQEDLVKLVMKANPNTILVVISSFPYAIVWSEEHVPAILHISQSSQELGNGVADVLFGKVSPAGRLVQTWSSSIDQLPPMLDYNLRNGRTYMYDPHEPLFPFGHGLTYTTFEYGGLKLDRSEVKEGEVVKVSLELTNTGTFDSDEVVQLYAGFPDSEVERPALALKSFKRVNVPAGKSIEVTLDLKTNDLTYWNVDRHAWELEKGRVTIKVGASSRDLRQEGTLIIQ
jgi:beta-glucosidase